MANCGQCSYTEVPSEASMKGFFHCSKNMANVHFGIHTSKLTTYLSPNHPACREFAMAARVEKPAAPVEAPVAAQDAQPQKQQAPARKTPVDSGVFI